MPPRRQVLANEEIYHVLNRGVASQQIFNTSYDYKRFIDLLEFYRFSNPKISFSRFLALSKEDKQLFQKDQKSQIPQIDIFSFCIMPNHYHLLIKQMAENGIRQSLSNLQNAYSKYFNLKYERAGPLFQSRFKAVRIENDNIFLHISRYIHLNPSTSYLVKTEKLLDYKWSSLPCYLTNKNPSLYPFINTQMILSYFKNPDQYLEFVLNQADYQKKLNQIKHLTLDSRLILRKSV